jgi:phosphate acetyltransferase
MSFIDSIYDQAKQNKQRIAISESTNELMMRAAVRAAAVGIADIVFVGNPIEINKVSQRCEIDLSAVTIVNVDNEIYQVQLAERYDKLPNKVMGKKFVARRIGDPLYMAMVMESVGDADCTFAGLDTTTYEFILAASSIIGRAAGVITPAALLIMEIEGFEGGQGNCFGMSDGAICLEPTSEELACISILSCDTFSALMGRSARCALLSSSTCGSGSGPSVDCIIAAVKLANAQRPDLMIDGEFQADAAINARVAAKKVKRPSAVSGRADVLIFPDAAACNIGTKLIQQYANSRSYGPIYMGFRQAFIDCSRGDTEERIFDNIALCGVMAANRHGREKGVE